MWQFGVENLKIGYLYFHAQKITCPLKEVLLHRKFNPAGTVFASEFNTTVPRIVVEAFVSVQLWIQASLSAETGVLGMHRKDFQVIKFCPQDSNTIEIKRWHCNMSCTKLGSGASLGGGKLETSPMRHKKNLKFSTSSNSSKLSWEWIASSHRYLRLLWNTFLDESDKSVIGQETVLSICHFRVASVSKRVHGQKHSMKMNLIGMKMNL